MKTGWIKTELKIGRPKWHFFDRKKMHGAREVSLCGQIRLYTVTDLETRHIMEAGNCLLCVKILKKMEVV